MAIRVLICDDQDVVREGLKAILKSCKDIERISHMEGLWIITQTGPEKTCVEYYVSSKQEPKFPTWITAPLIEKNLLNTMSAFRDVVMNDSK